VARYSLHTSLTCLTQGFDAQLFSLPSPQGQFGGNGVDGEEWMSEEERVRRAAVEEQLLSAGGNVQVGQPRGPQGVGSTTRHWGILWCTDIYKAYCQGSQHSQHQTMDAFPGAAGRRR
jgi:hypothetical protein